jgi:hypothetical protein
MAPLASPPLTGAPTAPTAPVGTNTTQLATTAFVHQNSTRSWTLIGQATANGTALDLIVDGIGDNFNLFALELFELNPSSNYGAVYVEVRNPNGTAATYNSLSTQIMTGNQLQTGPGVTTAIQLTHLNPTDQAIGIGDGGVSGLLYLQQHGRYMWPVWGNYFWWSRIGPITFGQVGGYAVAPYIGGGPAREPRFTGVRVLMDVNIAQGSIRLFGIA